MSAPNSRLNTQRSAAPAPVHTLPKYVDAGAVLQKAIRQLPPAERRGIILRCDDLADLQISEDALEKAFTQLLQFILAEKNKAELFLHITCSKEIKQKGEVKPASPSCFLLQFHTNLTPHAALMHDADRRINSIASLLQPFGGGLVVTQFKNSGCVFVITLPGK